MIRDDSCFGKMTTHAVAAVGYTPAYILIKNSWGKDWGEQGYVKFGRHHHGCLLHTKPLYPVLQKTGSRDSQPSERATSYVPRREVPEPAPVCKDNYPSWWCNSAACSNSARANDCAKSCGRCSFDKDTCPSGQYMCQDATCNAKC